MAKSMDSVADYYTLRRKQLAAPTCIPELQNHQPNQSTEQNHAVSHLEQA